MVKNTDISVYGPIIFLIIYFVLTLYKKIPSYNKEIAIVIIIYYSFIRPIYAISFLLLSVFYFYLVKEKIIVENFGENDSSSNQKRLYFVWGSKKDGNEHGLGDKLRCINYVYRYCKKNDIRMIFDAHQHDIGDFLKNAKCSNWKEIESKKVEFMKHDMKIEDAEKYFKREFADRNEIYIYAAMADSPNFEDKDGIEFLKHVLEPSDKFKQEIEEKKKRLPEDYTIKHVRFNDEVFTDDKERTEEFEKFYKMVNETYTSTDVLISNSKEFKKYVKTRLPIHTIECGVNECTTAHMAGVGAYPGDKESYKNTLMDFYIMCESQKISTYSQYEWVSNFANWASKLYGIPLENKQGLREWS